MELHGAVRLAISGAATCNVLETDTDYAERRANVGLDGPVQAFLFVQGRQGVGQLGPDRHRLRGDERPVPQMILQRAAGRRSHVQRRPRRGAVPPRRFRALGGAGVVGVVLRVAEFDCVLQLVDPRVGKVRDLRDRQQVIAAECGSAIPGGAAAGKGG